MSDRRQQIVEELDRNLEEIIVFFQSVTIEELAVQVYEDGVGWTVRQILAHLITIEQSMHRLFRSTAAR